MRYILFSAFGFDVFSAPVFAGLAGLAAFVCFRGLRRYAGLSFEDFWNLVLLLVLGVTGGALLSYVVLYNGGPAHNLPVLIRGKIPGGSFWGSLWSAAVLGYLYCRIKKIEFRPVADAIGLSSILALSVMRVGCFLHGCCHGLPTDLPWGVIYSDPRCAVARSLLGRTLHPTQLYESLGSLVVFCASYLVWKNRRLKPGGAFMLSAAGYSILRFAVDLVRAGDKGVFAVYPFTTAQLIALVSAIGSVLWYRRP